MEGREQSNNLIIIYVQSKISINMRNIGYYHVQYPTLPRLSKMILSQGVPTHMSWRKPILCPQQPLNPTYYHRNQNQMCQHKDVKRPYPLSHKSYIDQCKVSWCKRKTATNIDFSLSQQELFIKKIADYLENKAVIPKIQGNDGAAIVKKAIPNP